MASAALASTGVHDGLWTRYGEAYSVAAGIISLGKIVQQVALVVGALILLVSFVSALSGESWLMFGVGALITAIVSGGGWISGMITMEQGQIMQSITDDAANTSSLLDNPSKAQFLGVTSPGQSAARKDRCCGKSNQQKQNEQVASPIVPIVANLL